MSNGPIRGVLTLGQYCAAAFEGDFSAVVKAGKIPD